MGDVTMVLMVGDVSYDVDPDQGITVEPQYETIYSDYVVKADTRWRDEHGDHVHEWVEGRTTAHPRHVGHVVTEAIPTTRHVPCDGTCGGVCEGEGYDVPAWACAYDGTILDPATVPDPGPWRYRTGTNLSLSLRTETPPVRIEGVAVLVTARPDRVERALLGVVHLYSDEMTFEHGLPTTVTYTGSIDPS